MKLILAAAAASTILAGTATVHAADLDPVVDADVYRYFVAVRAGYGPSIIDNGFRTNTGATGEVQNKYLLGVSGEAGLFLTERFRVSFEMNYSKVEQEFQVFDTGAVIPVDGQTNVFQGFLKAGYEVPVADLGLTSRIFSRSSIAGFAGIGFTQLSSNAVANFGPFTGSQQADDIVLAGQVGLGTVTRINDRLDFVSETAFVFGGDATLSTVTPLGVSTSDVETKAITSRFGLRFKF